MRKPRSDSKLLSLPEEHQAKLAEWLLAGMPYTAVREAVAKEFGVRCSAAALSGFYQLVCVPVLLRRRSQAVAAADQIAEAAAATPGRWDQATLDALRQKAFELTISPQAEAKDVRDLFGLLLKARDLDQKDSQLALDRERFQVDTCEKFLAWHKDERARQIAEGQGSNREKIAALRQLMFADVEAAAA